MANIYHPSISKVEAKVSEDKDHLQLYNECQASLSYKRPCWPVEG